MPQWKTEIKKVEQCPQRQDSTQEQMKDLYAVANKLGFYDAADYIRQNFMEKETSYHRKVFDSRKVQLSNMKDEELYDIAYSYLDLEHGQGYYSKSDLIQMILVQEFKHGNEGNDTYNKVLNQHQNS